jgi:hypothetical protein
MRHRRHDETGHQCQSTRHSGQRERSYKRCVFTADPWLSEPTRTRSSIASTAASTTPAIAHRVCAAWFGSNGLTSSAARPSANVSMRAAPDVCAHDSHDNASLTSPSHDPHDNVSLTSPSHDPHDNAPLTSPSYDPHDNASLTSDLTTLTHETSLTSRSHDPHDNAPLTSRSHDPHDNASLTVPIPRPDLTDVPIPRRSRRTSLTSPSHDPHDTTRRH